MKRISREIAEALVATRRFPMRFSAPKRPHFAVVGIGGNLGDVARRFDRVVDYLNRAGVVRVVETSPLWRNPPFGYTDQPDFLNGAMLLQTRLSALELMRYLLWVEKRFGRVRSFKNAPRTLDLDIIFYDDQQIRTKRLHVPHPRFHERPSVTIPLAFLREFRR